MKLIHCILSITLVGMASSTLMPATADAQACSGGSCGSSSGGASRPGGGSGGGHISHGGHGGGGTNWGGVAGAVGAGIITGIITQQQMSEQNRQPVDKEPASPRRVQRRSGSSSSEDISDDLGDGLKPAVNDTSLQDLPPNQYAQGPSENVDTGIRLDAGSIGALPQTTTGSASPTQETTGSVGSSGSTTEPHSPGIPYEEPRDYLDWKGHVVEWLFDQGLDKGLEAIPGVGHVIVFVKSLASNGKQVKTGAQSASEKYDASNEMANERKAPDIESIKANVDQGQRAFGSRINDIPE
jgi:hypothetical protein